MSAFTMPTKQVSPTASPSELLCDTETAVVVDSSPTAAVSATPPKKSRFRRRKRTSSSTVPTYTRSLSSSQLSLDSSSQQSGAAAAVPSKQHKKKSLFKRLLKYGNKSSKLKVIETQPENIVEEEDDHGVYNRGSNGSPKGTTEPNDAVISLEQRGLEERDMQQYNAAMDTWKQALELATDVRLKHQIKCRMISLQLQLHNDDNNTSTSYLDAASELIAGLEPLDDDDGCALGLEGSPLLLELLMKHSCWALALQVSHTMPHMDPLVLARLHLEVALEGGDDVVVVEKYVDEDDEEEEQDDPLLGERRFQQLAHLSECHQLLLSYDVLQQAQQADDVETTYQALWQELAQAYGVMGEDELALGCSRSRLSHLTVPSQVALAHYDQALNVLAPVGQYELALKEAELALDVLERAFTRIGGSEQQQQLQPASTNTLLVDTKEGVDDGDDVDLLWMKLYQFKADVLCRMGRLQESIQSYEKLLQSYKQSSTHGPAECANVLYILGKLSVRAKQFNAALEYFDEEVAMTKSVVGPHHLAISKILHESARVADAGMMDYPRAVRYYQEALQVETRVYQQCKQQQSPDAATQALQQDARTQMGETKQCLGKLHFKMGDFSKAMKTTLSVDK